MHDIWIGMCFRTVNVCCAKLSVVQMKRMEMKLLERMNQRRISNQMTKSDGKRIATVP